MKVCKTRCNQCLFSDAAIVSNERREQILKECSKKNTHFQCHKHYDEGVCCRGFFDIFETPLLAAAKKLGVVKYV